MAINCYTKIFLHQINSLSKDGKLNLDVKCSIMKASIMGVITAIKKFSQRTIYTVDDGTGSLDCVLWNNKSMNMEKINKLKMNMETRNSTSNSEVDPFCHLLMNKIEVKEQETDYMHGDKIHCFGIVKVVNGKLLLDINHHYKVEKVNAETLWILDVLSVQKKDKNDVAF